jgi:hypothetical protein
MAITIQGPDGASIDFPDGTTEAEMNAAMAQAYPAQSHGNALSGAARALEANLPFVDRAVAGAKSILPQGYGGTGQEYAANLAAERAKNQQFAEQNPATNLVGGATAMAPLAALPGSAFGIGAAVGGLQGASSAPDLSNIPATAKDTAIGAATGGALGAAAPAVASGISKLISPFKVPPERQALADALRQSGINPTAGQTTGNKTLAKLEAGAGDIPFGGGGAEVPREANSRAFTASLMEKTGAPPGQIATPENLNAVHEALGAQFQALGERNAIVGDPQLTGELSSAVKEYHDVTGTPAPGIGNIVTKMNDDLSRGSMPGDAYNNMRSQLGKKAQALKFTDPAQAQAYRDVQGALDDAMGRSIDANNPADAGAFQDVRNKYRNLIPIENAAASAGADAASGIISPQQMRAALASGGNRRSYARGIGDLAPLTNAGNAILTNVPQSGTTPRMLAAHLLGAALPHAVGGGVGYYEGGVPGAIAGAAVPAVAARALMSRPAQAYFKNQVAPGIGRSPTVSALAAALAAYQGGRR